MFSKEVIIEFLENYYIDTEYYLSEYGEFLMEENELDISDIDAMRGNELIDYLDIERLCRDEEEIMKQIEADMLFWWIEISIVSKLKIRYNFNIKYK